VPHTHGATSSRLLLRFPAVQSNDLDEVRHRVAHIFCDHRLQVVGPSQRLDTRMYFRQGSQIGYGRMSYGAAVDIDPGRLDTFFLLQMPLRGSETIVSEGSHVDSNPRLASLVSPSANFHMRHGQNTEKLFLRIDRAALETAFVRHTGRGLKGPLKFDPAIQLDTPCGQALRRLIAWLVKEASEGPLFDAPLVAAQLESTLMATLIDTLAHNQQLPLNPGSIAPHFVRLAEDYIAQHAHEPLSAGLIAQEAGVSVRALFSGFRKYRDTTPMAFLRTLRLEKVREELLAAQPGQVSITELALKWGFAHLGQFAGAYRRRYGETPSATLKRKA